MSSLNSQRYRYEQREQAESARAIKVADIVKVTAYDDAQQTVDVQPISMAIQNGTYQTQPPILSVPVLCDLGNFGKKVKYEPGDIGLVLYCDADIDQSIKTGEENQPNTERNHSATDAVFIGGIRAGNKQNGLPEGYAIGTADGSVYVLVAQDGVVIQGNTVIHGNLTVNGNIEATGDVIASGISLVNHTHTCPDGETGAPS